MAYICAKNEVAREYTIIDLPLVNMVQGYLLLNSDVADDVELYGESLGGAGDRRRIRIFPDIAIGELKDNSVDFAFNQDSFPEMEQQTIVRYLDQIARIARGYLLSINHESGRVGPGRRIYDILRDRPEFEQVYHIPYWMRRGYVEELFRISAPRRS